MNWYNPTEGTWVVSGEFATSSILAGSGIWIEDAKGSGNLLITYTASGAKVFSSGVLQFSTLMAPAGVVTLADKGTLGSVKYHPRAFTDAEAIAMATGNITVSFTLRNLLNNSPQGVWYDPSDTTTLFQDSAGTTPVTASGQPVGLMLDKSKGLVRGPELVTNGGVDSDTTGWSSQTSTIRAVSGELEITSTGAGAATASFPITTVSGRMYEITGLARRGTSGDIAITAMDTQFGTTLASNIVMITGQQSLRLVFTAADATTWVGCRIVNSSGAGLTAYFDNISVRELPGNHATQPTAASRPIYRRGDSRGVVNLLKWSEAFYNAAWTKTRCTVTPNATTAPDGTMTADAYFEDATATASHPTSMIVGVNDNTGIALTLRFKKNVGRDWAFIRTVNKSGVDVQTYFDLVSGAVGSIGHTGASMVPEGNGWYACAVTLNSGVAVSSTVSVQFGSAPANGTFVFTGEPSKGIYIWGAQLNLGPTALPYQRNDGNLGGVATGASTDLHWLETDGVDDGMVTGNINFTGTDKVSVFTGLRKLSNANTGAFCEHGRPGIDVGAWNISAPRSASFQLFSAQFRDATNIPEVRGQLMTSPNTAIVYASMDYAALTLDSQIKMRENAVNQTDKLGTVASGNFGNHPLYLFRRGGTSLPFNGWFYGLAITGRLTTDAETVATERFLAAKSAVVIP